MSDPGMTSEQRAAIAVHNATQNRMCLNLSGNGQICVACSEVADQIDAAVEVERQAAEERGRRSAETERDELRTLLGKLVAWADLPATKAVTMSAWVHGVKYRAEDVAVWDEARAALAPRDSGPVCDAVMSSDPFREWRCGKPKDHEGPHSGDRK